VPRESTKGRVSHPPCSFNGPEYLVELMLDDASSFVLLIITITFFKHPLVSVEKFGTSRPESLLVLFAALTQATTCHAVRMRRSDILDMASQSTVQSYITHGAGFTTCHRHFLD
jgi:hypothetical protein